MCSTLVPEDLPFIHQEAGEAEQIHVESQECSRSSGSWEEHLPLSQVPLEQRLFCAHLGVQLQGRREKLPSKAGSCSRNSIT